MTAQPRLRLFIAAAVPRDTLEAMDRALGPLQDRLEGARWAASDGRHLTLKFLGPTPVELAGRIGGIVREVARPLSPGRVRLAGMGAFPKPARARVLWVGVEDRDGILAELAIRLADAFEELGYAAEQRLYVPHLTLARFKLPTPITAPLPALDELPELMVGDVGLYSSHLSPRGARYELLESFSLEGQ